MARTPGTPGRPSKLTESQWEDLLRKLASGDATVTELARRYKVSKTSISKRVSQHADVAKSLAHSLVEVETKIEALPKSQQRVIRTLADKLKMVQEHYADAAENGAEAAAHLTGLGRARAKELDENADVESLKTVAALYETANKALLPASQLIAANKGKQDDDKGKGNAVRFTREDEDL